ncbi:MAG: cytochrome c biogenesis protein ResB [Bdellovibrionales bacterium]|nr:cytochrome c biogenesis protein ResB [Bdellovibrionales bacterium]
MSLAEKIIKFFASIKLAAFTILAIGVVSAVGTITEAKYNDADMANKLVYHSPWMYAVLGLLIIQLVAVMIDRWPWKQHHAGFVLAHIGIIILLIGSWVTQRYGIDGSIAFGIGEARNMVLVKDRDLIVFASLDGTEMRAIYDAPADFVRQPPTAEKPLIVPLGGDELRIVDHHQFAFRDAQINASEDPNDAPAIRFQLENPNVNMTEWLRLDRSRKRSELDLGPAKVVLSPEVLPPSGQNEVVLVVKPGQSTLDYLIYNKDKSLRKKGQVAQAETIDTGWMGLKFRLLRYLPHAEEKVSYQPMSYFTPVTTSAAKFVFNGREHWVALNQPLKLYMKDRAYVVIYGNRQLPLGFALNLKEFRMDKYQGTNRAATYESDVTTPDGQAVTISMNEPLKYAGFTFYQSSFEQDDSGRPTVSVLSVNKDPGRWIKYLGSFLIVLGSVVLFWFKRVKWLKKGSAV